MQFLLELSILCIILFKLTYVKSSPVALSDLEYEYREESLRSSAYDKGLKLKSESNIDADENEEDAEVTDQEETDLKSNDSSNDQELYEDLINKDANIPLANVNFDFFNQFNDK